MPFFDTSPTIMFSGSMMDNIMSGALLSEGMITGSRVKVLSNVIFEETIGSLATDYGTYANYVTGSGKNPGLTKHSIRMVQCAQTNKQYYDTFMPSIDDIWKIDILTGSVMLALVNEPVTVGNKGALFFIYAIDTVEPAKYGCIDTITLNHDISLANKHWSMSYPYQGKYKNVKREKNVDYTLSNKKYYISASFYSSADSIYAFGRTDTAIEVAAAVQQMKENKAAGDAYIYNSTFSEPLSIATIAYFNHRYFDEKNGLTEYANDDSLTYANMQALYTTGGYGKYNSGNGKYDFSPAVTSCYIEPGAANAKTPTTPSIIDTTKHFFGFGRGPKNTVEFSTRVTSSQTGQYHFNIRYGSKMSGWKYGILNGFEQNPRVMMNRSHFGHLRDTFEPRLYSRWVDKFNGTFDEPIKIVFVSGSDAYITSSNPTLNVNDSGIYNKWYASGQPFTDQ